MLPSQTVGRAGLWAGEVRVLVWYWHWSAGSLAQLPVRPCPSPHIASFSSSLLLARVLIQLRCGAIVNLLPCSLTPSRHHPLPCDFSLEPELPGFSSHTGWTYSRYIHNTPNLYDSDAYRVIQALTRPLQQLIRSCYQHISRRHLRPQPAHFHPPPLLSLLLYQRQYASQRLPNVHRECRPQCGRPQAGVYRTNIRGSRPPHLIVYVERENRLGEQGEGIHRRLPERRPQPRSPRPVRLCCFRDPQAAHWEGPQGLGADRPERGNVRGGRRPSRQVLRTAQQQRHSGQHAPLPGLCHCNSRHASCSIRQVSQPPEGSSTRGRRQRTVCRILWSPWLLDPPGRSLSNARL